LCTADELALCSERVGKNAKFIICFVNAKRHPSFGGLVHNSFEHGIFLRREAAKAVNENLCTVKISVFVQNVAKNIKRTVIVKIILLNQCGVRSVDKQYFAELIFKKRRLQLSESLFDFIGGHRALTEIFKSFEHLQNYGRTVSVA